MHMTSALSQWLGEATQPDYFFYRPIQLGVFSGLAYIGTACLTKIPPHQGVTLIGSAYIISQFVTPIFIKWFEPYRDVSLAPLIGQVCQLAASLFLAKVSCNVVGQNISLKQAGIISAAFAVSTIVAYFFLRKFREAIAEK